MKLKNISFQKPINLQFLVSLSDFDEDVGPLSLVPYSQKLETNPLNLSFLTKYLLNFVKLMHNINPAGIKIDKRINSLINE